jgi:hypothetical protein
LIKVSQDDQKRKTLLQQVANQFHQEPYPKLVMLIEPNGSYKDSMIASRTDEIFSKPSRSIRAKKPCHSKILEKLGKTGNRRDNLAYNFVSGLLADKGKDLPPDCLHLAHAEAKTGEPAGQAHEAAAHRSDPSVGNAAARFPGRCVGSRGRTRYGREQGIDVRLWSLLTKERENHPDRFLGDLGFNAGGGNAGDQIFHLKPRRCA